MILIVGVVGVVAPESLSFVVDRERPGSSDSAFVLGVGNESSMNTLVGFEACRSSQGKMAFGLTAGGKGFSLGTSNHISLGGSG